MIAWTQVAPVLIALFTKAAVTQITSPGGVHLPYETPEWNAEWKNRRGPFIHPGQQLSLQLKVTSVVGKGWDENSFEELDTGTAVGEAPTGLTNVYEVTSGLRRFTLNVQAWVTEETDALSAQGVIDRVVTRMDTTANREQLLGVNVDLTDVGATRAMEAKYDNRLWNVVSVDFVFTACFTDTDIVPVGWIERIVLTSHEQNAGVDVQASLRMVEETLPPEE